MSNFNNPCLQIQGVNYESLTVDVNVLIANHRENVNLQNIPRTVYFVPLLEIYLTKPQDDGAGDIGEIHRLAERLDQFRFA